MKKLKASIIIIFVGVLFSLQVQAQSGRGFGIKAGTNYNSSGAFFQDARTVYGDPWNNLGYHAGVFANIGVGPISLRPEVYYTSLRTELNSVQLQTNRIDAPLLVNLNVLGPFLRVFGGPSFHYYLRDDLREFNHDKYNAGYQLGVGSSFGNFGIDFRYEKVLNGQTVEVADVFDKRGDFRFSQLKLSVSLLFN